MMPRLQALLWDVDGTLADTEQQGHRPAFNAAFAAAGLPWHWDTGTYQRLLQTSGGRERILAWMAEVGERDEGLAAELHRSKQQHYRDLLRQGSVPLRPGVLALACDAAAAGLQQWIVTTSGRAAVAALLHNTPELEACFGGWICGDDVQRKKPDPEAYSLALGHLKLPACEVLAIEDSPQGLAAAKGAGLEVVITTDNWSGGATALAEAALVVEHLGQGPVTLQQLSALLP